MMSKFLLVGMFAGALLFGSAAARAEEAAPAASEPAPVYAAKGEQTCLKCHDEHPTVDILDTPHAVKGDSRTPFANHGCESCHGASPEHVKSAARVKDGEKPVEPTVVFKGPHTSPVKDRVEVCLGCHENNARIGWIGSTHSKNDLACNSCHTIHAKKDPLLVKASQPEICFTCHAQQRAESFQLSHHPIREGKVVCADCHSVHGTQGGTKLLKEFTVNETCYNCHADKRGPMLFEHQPVREECTACHNPHGSPQARLLTERLPYLCLGCHSAESGTAGHPAASNANSISWFGGKTALPNTAAQNWNAAGGSISLYTQYRACTNCHSQIHGSNSPNGAYFFR
jgi:DmsE family decaheme c-type cytochrome